MNPVSLSAPRRRSSRSTRGGAMVEFVILNIILIPLMLYAIFLMDAAYMKLDLQETVVSGVWDYSQRNTEPPGGSAGLSSPANNKTANNGLEQQATTKALRVSYADHTSAFEDGAEAGAADYGNPTRMRGNGDGSTGPGGHKKHHTGFGAQYTFRFKEAPDDEEESDDHNAEVGGDLDTQLRCSITSDLGWTNTPGVTAFGGSGYNAGGEVRCKAIGFIYNYIVPERFLNDSFSNEGMSLMTKRDDTNNADGSHKYQGQGGRIANIVAEETASISFNTWALRNGAHQGTFDTSAYGANKWTTYEGKVDEADIGKRPGFLEIPNPFKPGPRANPFYKRVQYMYTSAGPMAGTYNSVRSSANDFKSKAKDQELIQVYNEPAALGGSSPMGLPNISGVFLTARYQPGSPGVRQPKPPLLPFLAGSGGFLSTPYDGPNNDYQQAAGARGEFYMGCTSQETPNCF